MNRAPNDFALMVTLSSPVCCYCNSNSRLAEIVCGYRNSMAHLFWVPRMGSPSDMLLNITEISMTRTCAALSLTLPAGSHSRGRAVAQPSRWTACRSDRTASRTCRRRRRRRASGKADLSGIYMPNYRYFREPRRRHRPRERADDRRSAEDSQGARDRAARLRRAGRALPAAGRPQDQHGAGAVQDRADRQARRPGVRGVQPVAPGASRRARVRRRT